jgi:hypothetical protein
VVLGQPVVSSAVTLYAADDDPGRVRLTLRTPHDAEPVRQALHAAQMVHDRAEATISTIPATNAPGNFRGDLVSKGNRQRSIHITLGESENIL